MRFERRQNFSSISSIMPLKLINYIVNIPLIVFYKIFWRYLGQFKKNFIPLASSLKNFDLPKKQKRTIRIFSTQLLRT